MAKSNTRKFYETIMDFRADMREIDAHYKPEYDRLNKFKDSEHYASSKAILDERRKKQVEGLRREAQERIKTVVDAMEEVYMKRPASAPNPEQLALLQALRMRESVSKDELQAAANVLKGCPVGERILEELARKNGHPMVLSQELSGDEVRQHLQSLRNSAGHLISKLEHPDSRRESVNNGEYTLFRLDVDPADESDALRIFGYIVDTEKFSAAVNGQ